MISALVSFLGGSVFRMVWGELSSYINKKQDHAHELEFLKLQADIDAKRHDMQQQAIKTQADLGIKTIEVQSNAYAQNADSDAFLSAVNATSKPSGVRWIDAWNQSIRPGAATWALVIISLSEFGLFAISDSTHTIASVALGVYLADRALAKRGK